MTSKTMHIAQQLFIHRRLPPRECFEMAQSFEQVESELFSAELSRNFAIEKAARALLEAMSYDQFESVMAEVVALKQAMDEP